MSDLRLDMILEGVVTNVAAFGAFIDIGVHQDGLVHVSALANKYVRDPHEVVNPGQIVKVKVLDIDIKRQRIALSMRLEDTATEYQARKAGSSAPIAGNGVRTEARRAPEKNRSGIGGVARDAGNVSAMALAFANLKNSSAGK